METKPVAVLPPVLPDDVLAAILGRLLARSLAVSRRVCRAWRDLVDERGLLLCVQRLLPHAVTGLFVNYFNHGTTHFLGGPSCMIDGGHEIIVPGRPMSWYRVVDHCNSLILYRDDWDNELCVCNPATRRWARLPRLPFSYVPGSGEGRRRRRAFLVFDPAASPHYHVLVEPLDPAHDDNVRMVDEWPPARWTWQVFSSAAGRWRERVFVRCGQAAGTAGDMVAVMNSLPHRIPDDARWRYAVHWRGALYVHCGGEYVSRLSLSDGKYRIIRSPIGGDEGKCVQSFIGRSVMGVYFVSIYGRHLRVWILHDDDQTTEYSWIPKHESVLGTKRDWLAVVEAGGYFQIQCDGPRILDDYYGKATGTRNNAVDWSSDDDIICTAQDLTEHDYWGNIGFLGFHPYKEVIFLATQNVAVTYHMNTSKVQSLGILEPTICTYGVCDSFVYTPSHVQPA